MANGQETNKILLIILAIFLPPVAVALTKGMGFHLILNIILVFATLGVGAIIHALWCVFV